MDVPETRYAKANDGIHVGHRIVGSGAADLVFVPYDYSNIEASWDLPEFASFVRASHRTRGCWCSNFQVPITSSRWTTSRLTSHGSSRRSKESRPNSIGSCRRCSLPTSLDRLSKPRRWGTELGTACSTGITRQSARCSHAFADAKYLLRVTAS